MKQPLYLVAGLGKTGLSIARYLQRSKHAFIVFDTRAKAPNIEEFSAEFPNVMIYLQHIPAQILQQITEIIASPGVSLDTPCLQWAVDAGIPVYGDIECLAREIHAPVIAITGTNGKSTVTTLVGEMARAAGYNVAIAGNIGTPVLDMLDDGHHYDLWVLELSSFQLDLTHSLAPAAATILNVSPDHLDRHHSMPEYVAAKQRIYTHAQVAVYNHNDSATRPQTQVSSISFGDSTPDADNWGIRQQENTTYLAKGITNFLATDALLIKGIHNWLNALAASALADALGIAAEHIKQVLTHFSGLEHRCQWVRTLDAVDWINDSKGTNIGATISAINGIGGSMQGKIVLIAGGQGKGADFNELAQPMAILSASSPIKTTERTKSAIG